MEPEENSNLIPPKGTGRRRSEASRRIEALEVGQRVGFRSIKRETLGGMAAYVAKKLGRKFATRLERNGTIAVWRVS